MNEKADRSEKQDNPENAYSDEFLRHLGAKFDFDACADDIAFEIRDLEERYFRDLNIFEDQDDSREYREQFRRLKKQITNFAEFLAQAEYADIETDMYFAALRLREPAPKTEFPQLSEHQKKRGAPYLAELIRLLRLLDNAADKGIEDFAPERGRKRNYPVENFTRRAHHIWVKMLRRPFTVDYHKGSGLTPAFDFVYYLLHHLDDNVPENGIVTAMRKVIADNNE